MVLFDCLAPVTNSLLTKIGLSNMTMQVTAHLIRQGGLCAVMQGSQGYHWLIKVHIKEVCGQLQRYGNEREQAICQATYGIHVGLHGSLVPRQKPLQHALSSSRPSDA